MYYWLVLRYFCSFCSLLQILLVSQITRHADFPRREIVREYLSSVGMNLFLTDRIGQGYAGGSLNLLCCLVPINDHQFTSLYNGLIMGSELHDFLEIVS